MACDTGYEHSLVERDKRLESALQRIRSIHHQRLKLSLLFCVRVPRMRLCQVCKLLGLVGFEQVV
jgi:hypothetical protein